MHAVHGFILAPCLYAVYAVYAICPPCKKTPQPRAKTARAAHVNRRPSTAPAAPQGNLNTRAIDELKSIYGERLVILSPGLASPFNLLAYWQAMRRST